MTAPYPWQQTQWQRLQDAAHNDRLAHALLLCAPPGTGLREFAEHWMRLRLCRQAVNDDPCGRCPACEQIGAGTHPDVSRVEPAEPGKAIGIDSVRAMTGRLGLTAAAAGKVALVDPADAMTLQAANSLLKILEEPPAGSVIILLADRPSRLPATIRSRCQMIAFGLPTRQAAIDWLQQQGIDAAETWLARAGGAPLRARELASGADAHAQEQLIEGLLRTLETGTVEPALIADLSARSLQSSVPLLAGVMTDLIRARIAAPAPTYMRHPTLQRRVHALAQRLDARAMFHYLDQLHRAVPGPSSALRPGMQIQALLADAVAMRVSAGNRNGGK